MAEIVQKLEKTPPEVGQIFESLLSPMSDDYRETIGLLQWVMYAARPLHPFELYQAVKYATYNAVAAETYDADALSNIRKYIITCSRGLVEFTVNPENGSTFVQFIHETVRD